MTIMTILEVTDGRTDFFKRPLALIREGTLTKFLIQTYKKTVLIIIKYHKQITKEIFR